MMHGPCYGPRGHCHGPLGNKVRHPSSAWMLWDFAEIERSGRDYIYRSKQNFGLLFLASRMRKVMRTFGYECSAYVGSSPTRLRCANLQFLIQHHRKSALGPC
jgi:hypothetical protein